MTAPVAINARAAARREVGGVERVAGALARELPRLRPGRYRVVRPPAALAHRAGHAWEQALLPFAARGAELILSPANLAPALSRRNVVMIHDLAPLARAVLVPRLLRRLAPGTGAACGPAGAARAHRVGVLEGRAGGPARPGPRRDHRGAARRGDALRARRRSNAGPGRPRPRASLRPDGGHPERPEERERPRPGGRAPGRGRGRPCRGRRRARVPGGAGRAGRHPRARLRPRRGPAGPLRRRARVRAPLALRGLRPAVRRGDGVRHARGGGRRRGPARGLRRGGAAGGPRRPRGAGRRRADRGLRRRSSGRGYGRRAWRGPPS